MTPRRLAAGLLAALVCAMPAGAAEPKPVWIGLFDREPDAWREVQLNAQLARNTYARRDWDGVPALEVRSQRSMSLMARAVEVDLAATPVLCWRWRIDAPLVAADLRTRAGDDYAARLYVSLGLPDSAKGLGLRAQLSMARLIWGPEVPDAALNYVWDNRQPVGAVHPNAYTDRAMMIVQRSGAAEAGRWVWERRDVAADARRHFGAQAVPTQVALTADTDNTGESAHAGFADLHFVSRDTPCVTERPPLGP